MVVDATRVVVVVVVPFTLAVGWGPCDHCSCTGCMTQQTTLSCLLMAQGQGRC